MRKRGGKMKKYYVLCMIFLLTILPFELFAQTTIEVGKNHWSYDALQYVAEKKILKENPERFDGTKSVSKSEFVYSLAQLLKLVELEKASQEDIRVLESLILQYSDELNRIGFDTKIFDQKMENAYDNIQILQERVNENEKKIDSLLKRVERLEKKK